MSGEPGGQPVRMPVALIDLMTAHQLKEGLLLALLKRYKTGEGSLVETSLYESAIAALANQATNWLMERHIPKPMGSQHPNIAPYGDIFLTKDEKPIVVAIGTDGQFAKLCESLNLQHLSATDRYKTNENRVKNRTSLATLLSSAFRQITREEILQKSYNNKIPIGCIYNMQEVFEQDLAKAMILEEELPDGKISKRVRTVAFSIQ